MTYLDRRYGRLISVWWCPMCYCRTRERY